MYMHRVNDLACSVVCSMATLHTHLWSVPTTQGYSFLGSKHLPPRISYCLHCKDPNLYILVGADDVEVKFSWNTISQIQQSLVVLSLVPRYEAIVVL